MRHFGYTFWWDNLMRQLMRHFEEIFLWDILMRYFGETFWSSNFGETYRWDILMRHFNETIWSDIVMSHFDETYWWDTLMRPLDETYWWDTLMRQIDEKFVRPLKNFNDRWLPLMTFDMVMMLMGWPYDSFDCLLFLTPVDSHYCPADSACDNRTLSWINSGIWKKR
jgi:hypothetical protein